MPDPLAVIFDMDGVLVDSYEAHYRSWVQLAEEHGLEMTEADFARTFGRTSREIIRELWGHRGFSGEEVASMDDRKEALYRKLIREEFPAMDGAKELLAGLKQEGFVLAIGSSGPVENVRVVVEALDPDRRLFAATVSGDDVTRGKPDPEVFLTAAEKLGIAARHCAVIEDAPPGVAAAKAATMAAIALASTGRTREQLADADFVVDSLRELSPTQIRDVIETAAGRPRP